MLGFELLNEEMSDGRPFTVQSTYTLSGFKNAVLRKHMENWRAKAFTDEEFDQFDITKVVGTPALLTLSETKEGSYVNITGISLPPKGTPLKPLVNDKQVLVLDTGEFNQAVFDSLSDRLKEKIAQSPEYKAVKSGRPVEKYDEALDDEIPF